MCWALGYAELRMSGVRPVSDEVATEPVEIVFSQSELFLLLVIVNFASVPWQENGVLLDTKKIIN